MKKIKQCNWEKKNNELLYNKWSCKNKYDGSGPPTRTTVLQAPDFGLANTDFNMLESTKSSPIL